MITRAPAKPRQAKFLIYITADIETCFGTWRLNELIDMLARSLQRTQSPMSNEIRERERERKRERT